MKKTKRRISALLLLSVLISVLALPIGSEGVREDAPEEDGSPFYAIDCKYDNGSVKIDFRMRTKDVKAYAGQQISVFSLTSSYDEEGVLSGESEPIQTGILPSNRSITEFKIPNLEHRLSAFVLAIGSGEDKVFSKPFYPRVESTVESSSNFKCVTSGSMSEIIDMSAGTAIIDVDTDLLESNNSGYLFLLDGQTYIFSTEYLETIDRQVEVYNSAGIDVFFRLYSGSNKHPIYSSDISTQVSLYAYVSFLFTKYAEEKYGGIDGLILGSTGDTKDIALLSDYYSSLYAIAAAVDDVGGKFTLAVPFTDSIEDMRDPLGFLCKLFEKSSGMAFTALVESHRNPYDLSAKLEIDPLDERYISAENISAVSMLLSSEPAVYDRLIYLWEPVADTTYDMVAEISYLYNYNKLFFSKLASMFIVSFKAYEAQASNHDICALKTAVKYVDSNESRRHLHYSSIVTALGITDWNEEIKGYSKADLVRTTLAQSEMLTEKPDGIKGSCGYFDFSYTSGISGWYEGAGCISLHSDKSLFGKALSARLDISEGNNSFVAYNYKYSESFKHADYITVDFSVYDGIDDNRFEFCIILGGDDFEYEYSLADVAIDTRYTVYLDARQFDESNVVKYIRVGLRGTEGDGTRLFVYSVEAESRTYSSQFLKELIDLEREKLKTADEENPDITPTVIVFITFVVIATAAVMLTISGRRRINTKKYERTKK